MMRFFSLLTLGQGRQLSGYGGSVGRYDIFARGGKDVGNYLAVQQGKITPVVDSHRELSAARINAWHTEGVDVAKNLARQQRMFFPGMDWQQFETAVDEAVPDSECIKASATREKAFYQNRQLAVVDRFSIFEHIFTTSYDRDDVANKLLKAQLAIDDASIVPEGRQLHAMTTMTYIGVAQQLLRVSIDLAPRLKKQLLQAIRQVGMRFKASPDSNFDRESLWYAVCGNIRQVCMWRDEFDRFLVR